jgi:hypothetical protein
MEVEGEQEIIISMERFVSPSSGKGKKGGSRFGFNRR